MLWRFFHFSVDSESLQGSFRWKADTAGYVYITGRKKEIINRAGEKVSPYEVEDCIRELPAVQQAAVIGLPDPIYGELVAAYVVATPGTCLTISEEEALCEAIRQQCRTSLSKFKCPAQVFLVPAIPTGATGKIQRSKLKKAWLAKAN